MHNIRLSNQAKKNAQDKQTFSYPVIINGKPETYWLIFKQPIEEANELKAVNFYFDLLNETIRCSLYCTWTEYHSRRRKGEQYDFFAREFHTDISVDTLMEYPLFKRRYNDIVDIFEKGKKITDLLNTQEAVSKAVIEDLIAKEKKWSTGGVNDYRYGERIGASAQEALEAGFRLMKFIK